MAQDSRSEIYLSMDVNPTCIRRNETARVILGQTGAYVCDYCGKTYDRKSKLKEHINFVHLKISRFRCDFCGKTCARKGQLRDHMHTHKNLTPYKCDICNRSYASKIAYNRHVKHKECSNTTPEIVLKCDICDKICKHQRSLKEHKRDAHGGVAYSCRRCSRIFRYRSSRNQHRRRCIGTDIGDDKLPSFTI